jgi:hypothetical protein
MLRYIYTIYINKEKQKQKQNEQHHSRYVHILHK